MTDEERLEFERLKTRVAELEARPSDPQALEAAIKGSAMEKVARLELASLPPGWDEEAEVRRASTISFYVVIFMFVGVIVFFTCHNLFGWPH
jgi:hypothetical protein